MHANPLEAILAGNRKSLKSPNSRNLLKLHVSSSSKDSPTVRQNSTLKARASDPKATTNSFHISKPSIGDGKEDLQRSSIYQLSPTKSTDQSPIKGFFPGTDFIPSKSFYLDKGFRRNRSNLPSIKPGFVTENEISINKSINFETSPSDHLHSAIGSTHHIPTHDFVKQGEYIRSNPHFNRFHRTLYVLDKIETEKLPLSKETFYYPEQVQMIESMVKTKRFEENDDIHLATKILKENKKEELDIPQGKSCYLKIYTRGKTLPLKVDIDVKIGTFEVFVSRHKEKPGFGNCDFYFTNTQFNVDYAELNDDITCVYFGINALEKSKISILCSFMGKNNSHVSKSIPKKPQEVLASPPKERMPTRSKSKGVYEFVNQNVSTDQLKMFEESISQIKAEKKRKLLLMANGKNWLVENKEIASEYNRLKGINITTSNKQWQLKVQKSKELKDIVEVEKKKKKLLERAKAELVKMEAEMQEQKARKKKEKFRLEASWMVIAVLFGLVKEISEKKRAMVGVNIFKKMKELTATQIQKKMRSLLNRTSLIKVPGHETEAFLETNDLEIRNQINLYNCLNAMALMVKQHKEETAGLVVSLLAQDLFIPMKLSTGVDKYIKRVIKVQKQWRTKRIISAAKVALFMRSWKQFCNAILEEEVEAKRKKYSQIIPQLKEYHVLKYARKYVRNRIRSFLKDVHAQAEKEKEAQTKSKETINSVVEVASKQTGQSNEETTLIEGPGTQKSEEAINSTFKSTTVFIKPTLLDIKGILDKIVEEMGDGKGGIKSLLF